MKGGGKAHFAHPTFWLITNDDEMERLLVVPHTSKKEDHFQYKIAFITNFVCLYDVSLGWGIIGSLTTAHIVRAGTQEVDEFAWGVLRIEFDL